MEWNDLFRHSPFFAPAFSQDSYISKQTDLENWGPSDRSSQMDQNSNKVIVLACACAKDKNVYQEIISPQLWFSFFQLQGTLHKGPSINDVGPFFRFLWPPPYLCAIFFISKFQHFWPPSLPPLRRRCLWMAPNLIKSFSP